MPTSPCAASRRARRSSCTSRCCSSACWRCRSCPARFWKPVGDENPIWLILGLLRARRSACPISCCRRRARWCRCGSRGAFPGHNPYRLFALSNLASLLALLGYPFLLEPWVATRMQAWGWSAGYALFVALTTAAAFASLKNVPARRRWPRRRRRPRRPPRASRRRRSRGSCCGACWPRPVRCCCSPSATTSRRTSPRFRCCGSCR